jgi:hypothetical protein
MKTAEGAAGPVIPDPRFQQIRALTAAAPHRSGKRSLTRYRTGRPRRAIRATLRHARRLAGPSSLSRSSDANGPPDEFINGPGKAVARS